jgi:hypothetical protein
VFPESVAISGLCRNNSEKKRRKLLERVEKHRNFASVKILKQYNYEDKVFFRSSVNDDGHDDRM